MVETFGYVLESKGGVDFPASSHYLKTMMMILSTKTRMLKPLIKSVILSFQPLQAVGKEADLHIKIKSIDFCYFYAILPIIRGKLYVNFFPCWNEPAVAAAGFSFIYNSFFNVKLGGTRAFLLEGGMCKQRVALDMIEAQHDHGGMSDAALLLHKKQCEDTDLMNKRINEIDSKIDRLEKKIDEVVAKLNEGGQFGKNLKEILSNKVFLYILISLICAAFGVSAGEVGTFLFKG